MSDEDIQARARTARAFGIGAEAVERDQARLGRGVIGFLEALVGKSIYIEGARINYRGTLTGIVLHGDGGPAGLILHPCQRVSYFNRQGPEQGYRYTHSAPRLVPWDMVHDVGEEGFTDAKWSAL